MQGCCHKTSTKIPTHFSWQLGQFQGHARVHVGLPSQTTKSFWLFLQPIKNAVQKDCQYPKLTPFLFFKTCVSFCTCVCSKKRRGSHCGWCCCCSWCSFFCCCIFVVSATRTFQQPFQLQHSGFGGRKHWWWASAQ